MTELTFSAGERATLDLRDSTGTVLVQDRDEPTIRVATAGEGTPFVLREQDTFRIRLDGGGTITLPVNLPVEIVAPPVVDVRVMRFGGETVLRASEPHRPAAGAGPSAGSSGPSAAADTAAAGAADRSTASPPPVTDPAEFARVVSEYARRFLHGMADSLHGVGSERSEDVARRLDEAAERIDEQARRVAERLQREVERVAHKTDRWQEHARHAAERAEERGRRAAERAQRHAERAAQRAGSRAGRGRWWFAEHMPDWPGVGVGVGVATGGAERETGAARGSQEERRVILEMLREGKISADEAARLLDALG